MPSPKILVVDDNKVIRTAYAHQFKAKGYTVETASDGEEAIAVFRKFQPHLILLDVMMPKENGYRVSRMIKTLGVLGDGVAVPRILLMTARHVFEEERAETLRSFSMADDLIYKPFPFEKLLDKVRELLGVRTGAAATGPDRI